MSSVSDPLVGHVLGGRYEILTKLARGGMATVYRARDQRLGRTVAVKVMRTDLGEDAEFVAKFDREARAAATLSHPNVVAVFDQGTEGGRPYIVMEYVEGQTLRLTVAKEAPLSPERVLELAEPVVAALAAAHEAGLVHRDIKPENVLISTRGQVKVADFGLARIMGVSSQTATGVLVGTASYLPPELVTKSRPDARSDVYSTGVMLFELLTGRKPHTGETNYQIAYAHVNYDISAPSVALAEAGVKVPWHIPDYLDAFVLACTRRDPNLRPSDGREMLEWLRRIRKSMSEGKADDPELTGFLVANETEPIAAMAPVPPSKAPAQMRPAPAEVNRVWRAKSTAGTPASSPTPVAAKTPIFPTKVSNDPVHKKRRGALMLIAVVLAAVLVGGGSWWFVSGRFTATPAMANQNQTAAESLAADADVQVSFEQEYSETVAAGLITRTEPAAGDRIPRGSTVTAWVSKGPERYEMPPVSGLKSADAQKAIEKANLEVGKVTEEYSEDVDKGLVIKASADSGDKLKKNTKIDLVVSKGPKPIDIKNYENSDASEAKKKLESAGFKVETSEENHRTVAKGDVISQSPSSGTGFKGDVIKLVVSKGPVMVTVPNVRSKTKAEAQKELETAGFVVKIENSNGVFQLGLAGGTDPAAGQSIPEGSTVILYIV